MTVDMDWPENFFQDVIGAWGDEFDAIEERIQGGNMEKTKYAQVSDLLGKKLTEISIFRSDDGDNVVILKTSDGDSYKMYHEQSCCEVVGIEDIVGDISHLLGLPLLMAEEVSNHEEDSIIGSTTWTFYKFATSKGYVTIRWCGSSNGYYSEDVCFERIIQGDGLS